MKIELDTDVRRLLLEQITTYEQLETLLLLHAQPAQGWSAPAVAAAVRIQEDSAAAALNELVAQRLVSFKSDGAKSEYQYAAADAAAASAVDRLSQAYSQQRLEVVKQMSANAIERVRSSAARTFSDAFIFRRKRDDR
ncbi:MAG: hypothetical protein ACREU2_14395 [Steroidobacteraceae bacterium]